MTLKAGDVAKDDIAGDRLKGGYENQHDDGYAGSDHDRQFHTTSENLHLSLQFGIRVRGGDVPAGPGVAPPPDCMTA